MICPPAIEHFGISARCIILLREVDMTHHGVDRGWFFFVKMPQKIRE